MLDKLKMSFDYPKEMIRFVENFPRRGELVCTIYSENDSVESQVWTITEIGFSISTGLRPFTFMRYERLRSESDFEAEREDQKIFNLHFFDVVNGFAEYNPDLYPKNIARFHMNGGYDICLFNGIRQIRMEARYFYGTYERTRGSSTWGHFDWVRRHLLYEF